MMSGFDYEHVLYLKMMQKSWNILPIPECSISSVLQSCWYECIAGVPWSPCIQLLITEPPLTYLLKNFTHTHVLSSSNHDLPHETRVTISQRDETDEDIWLHYTNLLNPTSGEGVSLFNLPFLPLTTNASSLDSSVVSELQSSKYWTKYLEWFVQQSAMQSLTITTLFFLLFSTGSWVHYHKLTVLL